MFLNVQVDEKQRSSVGFGKLLAAMNALGFSADEQKAIWHVLAGIYHLGVAGACKGTRTLCNVNAKLSKPVMRCFHLQWAVSSS